MKKQLTLTINESVRERAKEFARHHDISISHLVERYLDKITQRDAGFTPEPGSWTDQLLGAVKILREDQDMDYDEIKERELLRKYGQ